VLVENYRAGVLAKHGFGWDSLHARWPKLVLVSISGFGQTGPYAGRPAFDMVVQAMGGVMSLTGWPGGPPTRVGTSIGDITAGLFGRSARGARGRRRLAGTSTWPCRPQVAIPRAPIARWHRVVPGPLGARHPSIAPFAAFRARDRYLVIAAGHDEMFRRLCAVLGAGELLDDPRFCGVQERARNADALTPELEKRLAARDAADWLERLAAAGVPCGPIHDIAGVLADPQVRARNMIVTVDDPIAGVLSMPGNPIKLDRRPDPTTRPPAPELDADRAAILAELEREDG
jgi:CoA:oxalate CoA-transferase